MKDKIIETFNQLASVYEKNVDKTSLFNSEYERPAMLAEIPHQLKNQTVLDAGCAAGWYTEKLVGRGARVVATDISPEMVEATRRRVGDKAQVLCKDLEETLPFEDHSFDYILSSLTLHYIKDWNKIFSEFKRILKPGGILLFSIHHPFTDINLLQDAEYFSVDLIIDTWNKEGKLYQVPFYRRPLQAIINETTRQFSINKLIEPKPTMEFKRQEPEKYNKLLKAPQFLLIRATKRE